MLRGPCPTEKEGARDVARLFKGGGGHTVSKWECIEQYVVALSSAIVGRLLKKGLQNGWDTYIPRSP